MKPLITAALFALATLSLTPAASAEFLIGPRLSVTVPVPGLAPELGGAVDMRIASPTRMIAFGVGLQSALDGESGGLTLDAGHAWLLGSADRWVPYFGAGVQVRALFFEDTRVTTFAVQGQLGFVSARAGRSRFFAELRLVQNVLAFGAQDSLRGTPRPTPADAWRFEPSVQTGFLF
jgi:hypothetical protein